MSERIWVLGLGPEWPSRESLLRGKKGGLARCRGPLGGGGGVTAKPPTVDAN